MNKYRFIDLIYDVLTESDIPLSIKEIWKIAEDRGLTKKVNSLGKTPSKSMGSALYTDIKYNDNSKFIQVSKEPPKFFLRVKTINEDAVRLADSKITSSIKIRERDLHKLLATFTYGSLDFKCKSKTIYHESSKKEAKGKNRWIHPDMVGVYYPFMDYEPSVLSMQSVMEENPYKIFSFELKIELNYSTLREYYFQAVSNSSWAHKGYLAVLKMEDSDDFYDELRRLNNAFGIGIIKINTKNVSQSEILFQARERLNLDWDTINRLVKENKDFESFIGDVLLDSPNNDKRLIGKYDDIFGSDEEAYDYSKAKGIINYLD